MASATLTAEQQKEILQRLDRGEVPNDIATDMGISKHKLSALLSKLKTLNTTKQIDTTTLLYTFKTHVVYTDLEALSSDAGITVEAYLRIIVKLLKTEREDNNLLEIRAFANKQIRTGVLPMRVASKSVGRPASLVTDTSWDDDVTEPTPVTQLTETKRPVGRPSSASKDPYANISPAHQLIIDSYPSDDQLEIFDRLTSGETVPMGPVKRTFYVPKPSQATIDEYSVDGD